MMKKKRILLTLTGCLLVIGASIGATYAYLTAKDFRVNEFVTADNTIEIEEEFQPPDKLDPQNPEARIITKKVWVRSTGNVPCFVRVRVEFSDSKAEAFCEPITFHVAETDNWVKGTDGYFYYKQPLAPGELTAQTLFDKIVLKEKNEDGELYTERDMEDFDVYVYAESCEQIGSESFEDAWNRMRTEEGGGG